MAQNSADASLSFVPAALPPTLWADPTVAFDARSYSDVEVQVVGTPSPVAPPTRSLDGTNYVACNAYDKSGTALASISAAGIYSLPGGGYLKFSTAGGATFTVRAGS